MGKLNIPRHNIPTPEQAFNEMLGVKQPTLSPLDTKSIIEIELDKLIPYPNQPFKPYTKEKLEELAEDIKTNGVLSPAIVRPHPTKDGCYEILAGRNRRNATQLANITSMPCIIKEVDESAATLIMVNTNLNQRQELLPSEKAFAYKMQLEAIKQRGKRNDLVPNGDEVDNEPNLVPNGDKVDSGDLLANKNNESRTNIFRLIRLTYLIPLLLNMVDNNELPMRAGVELSYIHESEQKRLYEYIIENKVKISLNQAEQLRELEKERNLYADVLDEFFNPTKPTKEKAEKKKTSISIKFADIEGFVDIEQEDLEGYIFRALQAYKNNSDGE